MNRIAGSDTTDEDLDLYQLHCRYAILGGLNMSDAARRWHEMRGKYADRESHMSALFAQLPKLPDPGELEWSEVRIVSEGQVYISEEVRRSRSPGLSQCRLEIDNNQCQYCGFRAPRMVDGPAGKVPIKTRVLEVHHINPIQEGKRETRLEDLITLCPTCHRLLHAIGSGLGSEDLSIDLLIHSGSALASGEPGT